MNKKKCVERSREILSINKREEKQIENEKHEDMKQIIQIFSSLGGRGGLRGTRCGIYQSYSIKRKISY